MRILVRVIAEIKNNASFEIYRRPENRNDSRLSIILLYNKLSELLYKPEERWVRRVILSIGITAVVHLVVQDPCRDDCYMFFFICNVYNF